MKKNGILILAAMLLVLCSTKVAQCKSYSKKPLYKPSKFNDVPPGFPNSLIGDPLVQGLYDYTRRVHFGFALSVGALDYKIASSKQPQYNSKGEGPFNYFVDVSKLSPSMGVAALMDYRINHSFSVRLQLGPTFGSRDLNFFQADTLAMSMQMESVLIEMPIVLKYKARRHSNVRPYMMAGFTPYCDVASFKKFNEKRSLYVGVKSFDLAYTAGIGLDIYADFFKFSLELKYVAGMTNTISSRVLEGYEQYPNAIDKMYMRSFVLSLIFE